jgi:hypothetical protein
MRWYQLAATGKPMPIDFDLMGRIANLMPRVIPEAGAGMWTDELTDQQVERIREALEEEDEVRRILSFLQKRTLRLSLPLLPACA